MDFQTSRSIYEAMQRSGQAALRRQLVDAAVRYARIRTDYFLVDPVRRAQMEADRTRAHEVLIDACNILARAMKNDGEDIEWRVRLTNDRKVIGDFACHLHALLGIRGR
jgi:hypothetical protein